MLESNTHGPFPDVRFSDISQYFRSYISVLSAAAATIDLKELEKAAVLIEKTVLAGGTIYSCGNGGSAAIANHLQCDFMKGIATFTALTPKVVSLSCESSTLTAIANDIGYEEVFGYQLQDRLEPRDLLIAISSSGASPNILRALQVAQEEGAPSILFSGFKGGEGKAQATVNLHYKVSNYGVIEDLHQVTMHLIAQYLRMKHLPATHVRISEIKF